MLSLRFWPRIPTLLATILYLSLPAAAVAAPAAAAVISSSGQAAQEPSADLRGEAVSLDVKRVADWAVASVDNDYLPFVIVDKINARVFVFDGNGMLVGAAPVLLGLSRSDDSVPGIGKRRLATISAGERTTPSGRFVASLGHDLVQDILWIDYASSLSLHRVITSNARERRAERLASATVDDNRISYGCINVPAKFYDEVVARAFKGTVGIVYILPETRTIESVFAMQEAIPSPAQSDSLARHAR